MKNKVTFLECSACNKRYSAGQVHHLCDCGEPLLIRYDLDTIQHTWKRQEVNNGLHSMWRYAPVLPTTNERLIITLGEGMTPLVKAHRIGKRLGASDLWIKDDSRNPTGSYDARGMSCAISMAVELGITKTAIASTGNAAGALAAYAAAAGMEAHVFLPNDAPPSNFIECNACGARVTLVEGPVDDCAKLAAAGVETNGWYDVSDWREPYRMEGGKTAGYELAGQFHWELPDAILYPTGGGLGLAAMGKAFEEMQALGWIGSKRPKMVAVQAEGCMPVVRAFQEGERHSRPFENAHTVASGLRVPNPRGDLLVLDAVRASGGAAIAVSDEEILDAGIQLASEEGLFAAPEGASCVAALRKLLADGFLRTGEKVVIYNTGSGLKHLEAYATRFPRTASAAQDKLGGLITPR